MTNRLRIALTAVVTLVATALVGMVPAPAAHADAANGCMKPSLTGTVGYQSSEGNWYASYTNTKAFANATCGSANYTYKVSFYPWVSNSSAAVTANQYTASYTCGLLSCTRTGTKMSFPSTTVLMSGNFQSTYIKIEALRYNYGFLVEKKAQYYRVDGLGDYSTTGLTQVADPTSCSTSTVPQPLIGSRGFCP